MKCYQNAHKLNSTLWFNLWECLVITSQLIYCCHQSFYDTKNLIRPGILKVWQLFMSHSSSLQGEISWSTLHPHVSWSDLLISACVVKPCLWGCLLEFMSNRSDTYNKVWSNYPIDDGTEAGNDDSDTDEDYRGHQLKEKRREESTEESHETRFSKTEIRSKSKTKLSEQVQLVFLCYLHACISK